jgi:aryl-alcohol dehydrogenase
MVVRVNTSAISSCSLKCARARSKTASGTWPSVIRVTNPAETIRDITGGGVDYSLETSGNPRALHQAIEALGSLGRCGIVGAEPLGTEVSFDVNNLMIPGKGIRGILEGESVPDIFIPQLIELNAQGRFPFKKLLKFYSLDQINQAAQDSERGGTIKPIIRLSPA